MYIYRTFRRDLLVSTGFLLSLFHERWMNVPSTSTNDSDLQTRSGRDLMAWEPNVRNVVR